LSATVQNRKQQGAALARLQKVYIMAQKPTYEDLEKRIEELETAASTHDDLEKLYRSLFDNLISGYVLFEVVQDDHGTPTDLVILAANKGFELITGLDGSNVIGTRLTHVLPNIEGDSADWIGTFGSVALTGETHHFDQDSELFGYYFSIIAFQAGPKKCAVSFQNITERRTTELKSAQYVRELSALKDLGLAVNASLSFNEVSSLALQGIMRAVNPDMAFFFLRDGDRLILQDVLPSEKQRIFENMPEHKVGECICGITVSLESPLYSRDIRNDPRCTWDECKLAGITSFATLPVKKGAEIIGVIGVAAFRSRDFENQAGFLETIAQQISMAVVNAQLYESVQHELTERQKAEESLKEIDTMLLSITSLVPGMLYQFKLNPEGVFSVPYSSIGIMKTFGCSPEDVKNDFTPIINAILPEDRKKVIHSIEESAKNLSRWSCEYRVQLSDQPIKWILGISMPEKISDGSIVWSGYNVDISDRIDREEELRESEERLHLVMEGSKLGFWDWNIKTGEVQRNERWAEMLGYTLDEIKFTIKQWTDLHHPDDCESAWKSIQDHLDGKTPVHRAEYRMRSKSGEYKWILDQAMIVKRDERGNPLRMSGTHTDITEFKRQEELRERLQAQLNQAQKIESIGRLAGGVAHDFNNKLSVILGYTEMILDQREPGMQNYAELQEIQNAALHSTDITRKLLAFARKQDISPHVLNLNETIGNLKQMLQRLIGENIKLSWLPEKNLGKVKIDPSQIDQIISNLCINARDAIHYTGKITIETDNVVLDEANSANYTDCLPGDYVMISVTDNGSGMDPQTIPLIFEPFFTTKKVGEGTGLGLATVYGIVKQNNGFIDVSSEPGRGTTFKIYFPRHKTEMDSLSFEVKGHIVEGGKETILLVEDEPAILKMTQMMLEKLGYSVIPAVTPSEAIRLAKESSKNIHLLITDVVMPEMNGRDLGENLHSLFPGLKQLFMSGYTADIIAQHGVLDENINFIQKPFSIVMLSEKVRKSLDKR
jgi:PAS domain S-box-containing protein